MYFLKFLKSQYFTSFHSNFFVEHFFEASFFPHIPDKNPPSLLFFDFLDLKTVFLELKSVF